MVTEQEIPRRNPARRQFNGFLMAHASFLQSKFDGLASSFGVCIEYIKRTYRVSERPKVVPVTRARFHESINYGEQKGASSARWLDDDMHRKVSVGRVANEVEDQLYYPSPRKNLAIVHSEIWRKSWGSHRLCEER
jgi:hypothetical protein